MSLPTWRIWFYLCLMLGLFVFFTLESSCFSLGFVFRICCLRVGVMWFRLSFFVASIGKPVQEKDPVILVPLCRILYIAPLFIAFFLILILYKHVYNTWTITSDCYNKFGFISHQGSPGKDCFEDHSTINNKELTRCQSDFTTPPNLVSFPFYRCHTSKIWQFKVPRCSMALLTKCFVPHKKTKALWLVKSFVS